MLINEDKRVTAISNEYRISLDDFYKWNPGVGSDCSKLWLGYAVCVGV